jgi:hypothetical protein
MPGGGPGNFRTPPTGRAKGGVANPLGFVLYYDHSRGIRRVRKLIVLLPVAGLALVLSGCGQLMNIIYPSNAMTVDVHVLAENHPDWSARGSSVTVTVTSDAGQTFSQTDGTATFDGTYAHFTVTITKLPNQTYTLVTSYTSGTSGRTYYASPAPEDFLDPTGTRLNMIQMPYASGALASNGHSIALTAIIE